MKKEYLYAGISILFWGSSAAVIKLLLNNINSMQILLISSGFAFLFMFIVNLIKGNLKQYKYYNWKDYASMVLIGLLGTFFYQLFFYMGVSELLAQEAFIINYLWPIMTVVFACILLKEKMTWRKAIALFMSFAGIIIVTTKGNLANIQLLSIKGIVFEIMAAGCYGLFSALNKKKRYDKSFSMMIFYLSSFVVSLAYIIITNDLPRIAAVQLMGLMWNGIFVYAIAYTTWALALEKGNTAKISNLAYITPFLSLIYIYFLLHEAISIYSIIGLVVIILGIIVQMDFRKPPLAVPLQKAEKDDEHGR